MGFIGGYAILTPFVLKESSVFAQAEQEVQEVVDLLARLSEETLGRLSWTCSRARVLFIARCMSFFVCRCGSCFVGLVRCAT